MLDMRIPVLVHLSEAFTLEPGDAVRVEVDRIGSLTNTVIDEPGGFVAEPTDAATACALSVLS
jgi:protein involved in polysaccharide export with SLBB domain